MLIRRKRRWKIAESDATGERAFPSRRDFLGELALGVGALAVAGCDSKSLVRGSDGELLKTIEYNGYGAEVRAMYE